MRAQDPYANDPLRWGASMAHHAQLMLACLDAAGARSVLEVGAYAGDLTRLLADWAADAGASVAAIDPAPQPALVALAEHDGAVELITETSLAALPAHDADAVVIDGDHNYWTVSEELRLIAQRAEERRRPLPLLLFHDLAWPHGRRDDYFDIAQIPPAHRHEPLVGEDGISPGDPGVRRDGLPYPRSAAHEGGPGNGVLTAVEDFVAGRDDVSLAVVPAFFGFGVAWPRSATWAGVVQALLGPYDGHPLLAALEANRVAHIAGEHALRVRIWDLEARLSRQETVLRRLLDSSAFAVAEGLSRMRVRLRIATGESVISRRQVRRALGEPGLSPRDPDGAGG